MVSCLPLSDPDNNWSYCPALAPAILFAILFAIPTAVHVWQAFRYRKAFGWVIIMAGCWEVAGYVFRSMSVLDQTSSWKYIAQFLLILLAPLWINAFVYMILGRMLHFYLEHDKVLGLRARKITLLFVMFDISSFIIQLYGGLKSSGTGLTLSQVQLGLHIYTGGIVLQLCFIGVFFIAAIRFQRQLKLQDRTQGTALQAYEGLSYAENAMSEFSKLEGRTYAKAKPLLLGVYLALGLIIFRNIYRLVEYALGVGSAITLHEWFQYVFDGVPMFAAMIVLNVWHPGKYLQGPRCDFKEENQARKQAKKDKKEEKKADKEAKKTAKQAQKADGKGGTYHKIDDSGSGEHLLGFKWKWNSKN